MLLIFLSIITISFFYSVRMEISFCFSTWFTICY